MASDDIEVKHFIPGRVRLKVPAVRRSPDFATRVRQELGALGGVHQVEINETTASVIVQYDPGLLRDPHGQEAMFTVLGSLFPSLDLGALRMWLQVNRYLG